MVFDTDADFPTGYPDPVHTFIRKYKILHIRRVSEPNATRFDAYTLTAYHHVHVA